MCISIRRSTARFIPIKTPEKKEPFSQTSIVEMVNPKNQVGQASCIEKDSDRKEEVALNEISFNFTSYLQTFMLDSGYQFSETEVFTNTFLAFMHNSLFFLIQHLVSLKSNLNQNVCEEEQKHMDAIYIHSPLPEIGPQIDKASKLMKSELPDKIKRCMIDAKFRKVQVEDSHQTYVSMVSMVLISETGKFLRFKERFKYTASNDQSQNDSALSLNKSADEPQLMMPSKQENQKIESVPPIHIKEIQLNSTLMNLLATSAKYNIYHLPSENMIMKVLNPHTSTADVNNLDNEFKIGSTDSHPSIRRSYQRIAFQNKQAILLECVPGIPINFVKNLSVKKFLALAREITYSLLAFHTNHLMLMNLSCEHVIYNEQNDSIKLISFGSCTPFANNRNYISNVHHKDLHYVSPEQTSRVNRYTDYRSDFYSLGVIFYKLLTGIFPFESNSQLNLLHMHISQDPVSVCTINPNIPVILSNMVSILLAKNAENRYQSTKGIVHDLDLMISEYDTDINLSSIVLMQHDLSQTLMLPQKLYGFSNEYNALSSVFDKIPKSFELVMISGDPGTGKSALVFDLYREVAKKDGMLISGKCHFSSPEPYSALLTAFNNFCDDLLLKDKSTVINCQRQISNAVGQEGGILTSVITNLSLIIGQQPSIADAFDHGDAFGQGSKTAKNRFHYVFVKLIKAICSVGFPIVLVLEDLQWMDLESLSLLSTLVTDKSIKNLMLVGTYRENEVKVTDPVNAFFDDAKNSVHTLTLIKLNNFNHDVLNELISDALFIPLHETYNLTAFIYEKTQGNPFFVNQMVRTLSEQGLIFYCNELSRWTWDEGIFGDNDISKNVLELFRSKIQALDENCQQVLVTASCLGSTFTLQTLQLIVNRTDSIESAVSSGLIAQQNGNERLYRFVHHQVQQAAFSLLPPDPKEILLYIGKKLCRLYSKEELNKSIFVVTHLINYARDLITDQEERSSVAELFLQADNRAITLTAFNQAFGYLEAGIEILGEKCWESNYDLSLKLYDAAAKSAYCISNYDSLESYIKAILKNATSTLDTVQTYSLQIRFYNDNRKFQDAFDTALCILNKIGENTNFTQSEVEIDAEIQQTKILLSAKSHEEISEMETMKDENKLAIMTILSNSLASQHFLNPQIYCLVSLRMVNLTLQYGIAKCSSIGFIALGTALCTKFSNMMDRFPYELGKLAIMLLDKVYVKEFILWVYGPFYALINPFYNSIHESVEAYVHIFKVSLEVGSNLGAIFGAATYCSYALFSGKNLEKLNDNFADFEDIISIKYVPYKALHQAVSNLLGNNTESPSLLKGEFFDHISCYDDTVKPPYVARILVFSCMVAYLFDDYTTSLSSVQGFPVKKYVSNIYHYPIMLFFEGLASLAMAKYETDKKTLINVAEKNIAELRNFSQNTPQNFENKLFLMEAELAVVQNDSPKAFACFKEAIRLSRKHGFIHEEAMAYEKEGLFLLELKSLAAAHLSLRNAYNCYEKWNAKGLLQKPIFKHIKEEAINKEDSIDLHLNNESECSVSLLTETSFASNNSKRKRVSFKL